MGIIEKTSDLVDQASRTMGQGEPMPDQGKLLLAWLECALGATARPARPGPEDAQ